MSKRIVFWQPEDNMSVEFKVSKDLYENLYSLVAFLAESGHEAWFQCGKLEIRRKYNETL